MTKPEIDAIFAQYQKHGWVLRRILLTDVTRNNLGSLPELVVITASDIDAAWFSRPPQDGEYAWEIRFLGPTPFALVEHFDDAADDFEERLAKAEDRLRNAIAAKPRGH